jgi:hypothetical protein
VPIDSIKSRRLLMFTIARNERSLIIISAVTYFLVAIVYVVKLGAWPSGDEPHYLLMTETLIKYHSLDIMRAYEHGDYWSFYPAILDPQIVWANGRMLPIHQIGASVLWLIPFWLFGRLGAVWFMSAVCVLIVLNMYWFLLAAKICQPIAHDVGLMLALASPLCIYAHMVFVEPIGAFVCIYVMRKFIECDTSLPVWLLSSILLGLLPWVNVRFILIEAPLFFMMLWQLSRRYHQRNMRYYLACITYILPIALLTLGLEAFSWWFTGSLNPVLAQSVDHNGNIFVLSPFAPFFGLFFDQAYGLLICFPCSALLLTGLILAMKKRYLIYNLAILFVSLPYMLGVSTYFAWHGGWTPPARYISVLLPIWSFYLACVLQQVNGCFVKLFVRIAFWWGIVYNLLSLLPPTSGFNGVGPNNVLAFLHTGSFYLTNLWPSVPDAQDNWSVAQSYHLISTCNLIWIAAYLLLTAFLVYQSRSDGFRMSKGARDVWRSVARRWLWSTDMALATHHSMSGELPTGTRAASLKAKA